ncbi:MAG: hypothetical protein QXJ17_07150 [Nitrososphaeria archaeon]
MSDYTYTLGSLLSTMIEIEGKVVDFYKNINSNLDEETKSLFYLYSEEHKGVKEKMEAVKRETVIEFTLEAISGLNLSIHINKIMETIKADGLDGGKRAVTIERELSKLYLSISERVAHMSGEASQLLILANKKAKRRLDKLEGGIHC